MRCILMGERLAEDKMKVTSMYNGDVEENEELDLSEAVIVTEMAPMPTAKLGKRYVLYVNPQTGEQWYEEIDRPLTNNELIKKQLADQQAVIDALVLDALGGAL